jgi:hypothetical protein
MRSFLSGLLRVFRAGGRFTRRSWLVDDAHKPSVFFLNQAQENPSEYALAAFSST